MGATGSSDAHEIDVVGRYFTEFPGRIETMAEFVLAIRNRQGRPGNRAVSSFRAGRLIEVSIGIDFVREFSPAITLRTEPIPLAGLLEADCGVLPTFPRQALGRLHSLRPALPA